MGRGVVPHRVRATMNAMRVAIATVEVGHFRDHAMHIAISDTVLAAVGHRFCRVLAMTVHASAKAVDILSARGSALSFGRTLQRAMLFKLDGQHPMVSRF